jgi:anaerobic selenocysteine-containing dehydrogenase
MNSTFGNREAVDRQTAHLHMTADDAARRGIADADRVRVWNDRGSCLLVACVDDSVHAGVVCAPAVRWGRNANALTSERLSDAGGGATFYSCLVEVERIGD